MESFSSVSKPRWKFLARPAGILLGASLLGWRTHWAPLSVAAVVLAGCLLVLAVIAPRAYAPFDRILERAQTMTVQVFSWILLFFIFALIFLPGRFLLPSMRRRFRRKANADTYWLDCPEAKNVGAFERQF